MFLFNHIIYAKQSYAFHTALSLLTHSFIKGWSRAFTVTNLIYTCLKKLRVPLLLVTIDNMVLCIKKTMDDMVCLNLKFRHVSFYVAVPSSIQF